MLFATLSGAHLYGFPSPDSDWDLRGMHVLPVDAFLGLGGPRDETVTIDRIDPELHLDLVTHDVRKFLSLLRKPNGYVLEQLLSPWVLHTTPLHQELVALAPRVLTREHARHYLGFAQNQWKLWTREEPFRAKPLLYIYRVLLTGLHLLRTGRLECDLNVLLDDHPDLADVRELIHAKRTGSEDLPLAAPDIARHHARYEDLCLALAALRESSRLPQQHHADPELEDFLRRARLKG